MESDKSDHHYIISAYNSNEILPDSYMTSILSLLSIFFVVQKLNDNLMAKWQACFYPLYLLLIYQILKYFIRIIRSESNEDDQNKHDEENKQSYKIKIQNFDKIVLISNFFSLINSVLIFLTVFHLGEFLDKRQDHYLLTSLYMLLSMCVSQVIYSALRKTSLFYINSFEDTKISHNSIAFISTLTGPILTYFSNMMIVCSSSGGVCTQVYMSTVASLLGAFGVTLSDFSEYLFPITIVLLGISLFSLYIKNKMLLHKPFLLGCFSAVLIIMSHILEGNYYYLVYPGNVLMIAAAIWNARVNKFYGLPRYSK